MRLSPSAVNETVPSGSPVPSRASQSVRSPRLAASPSGGLARLSSPASCALEESLRRALRKQKVVCKNPKKQKAVHDLRVSLRRCRSLAENFSELDLHPVWRHLAKACKTQQQGLNDPRDAHVIAGWTHKLKLDRPSSGRVFAETIKKEEHGSRRKATKSLGNFPRKRWKHWLHSLPARADMIPVGESRLALLALERLGEAEGFERHWRKTRSVAAWHKLRVAVKRFRYTVESFLPEQHVVSEKAVKRLQDILGDGHDLDVLRERILQFARDT